MRKSIQTLQKSLGLPADMKAFARGNSKLPKTTLIINHTTATDCPAEKYCDLKHRCYAKRCEERYKSYYNRNLIMERFFERATFNEIKKLVVEYLHDDKGNLICDTIRLNEAGDFKSQRMVSMFSDLALFLRLRFGVVTYAYTCRIDLDFRDVKFIVNASNENVNHYDRLFKATPASEFDRLEKGSIKCIADCKKCKLCSTKSIKSTIYCKIH